MSNNAHMCFSNKQCCKLIFRMCICEVTIMVFMSFYFNLHVFFICFFNMHFIFLCRFISADKAVGAQGFRAVWTEVSKGPDCEQFTCTKSRFCISKKLKCNRVDNCGDDDRSDEMDCE